MRLRSGCCSASYGHVSDFNAWQTSTDWAWPAKARLTAARMLRQESTWDANGQAASCIAYQVRRRLRGSSDCSNSAHRRASGLGAGNADHHFRQERRLLTAMIAGTEHTGGGGWGGVSNVKSGLVSCGMCGPDGRSVTRTLGLRTGCAWTGVDAVEPKSRIQQHRCIRIAIQETLVAEVSRCA